MTARILVVDNYDSFVYNIVQYLGQLGAEVDVRRNDEVTPEQGRGYDGVLLSPGPGTPSGAGVCLDMVHTLGGVVPLFGVCLGHQAIGEAFGAEIVRAPELLHGKTSRVHHEGAGVLEGLPDPFTATRYHSLTIDPASVPAELEVTARTDTGVIMAVRHRTLAIEGVQFHPESVLTEGGHRILANWLTVCGDRATRSRAARVWRPLSSASKEPRSCAAPSAHPSAARPGRRLQRLPLGLVDPLRGPDSGLGPLRFGVLLVFLASRSRARARLRRRPLRCAAWSRLWRLPLGLVDPLRGPDSGLGPLRFGVPAALRVRRRTLLLGWGRSWWASGWSRSGWGTAGPSRR